MLDTLNLKAARIKANVSVEEIAKEMGLNPVTVYRKFDGKSDFTVSELIVVKRLLHLSMTDFYSIFFGDELAET